MAENIHGGHRGSPRDETVSECHSEPQAKNLLLLSCRKTDASLSLSMTPDALGHSLYAAVSRQNVLNGAERLNGLNGLNETSVTCRRPC
jgi:hypothetical protein